MNRVFSAAESSPESLSRSSTHCSPSPTTAATEPDISILDASLDDVLNSTGTKHVLVTGGLGFIGSHTCVELLKAGYNVIIVDDLSNSFLHVLDRILEIANRHFDEREGQNCPDVKFHQLSYQNESAMRDLLELYSSASQSGVGRQSDIVGVIHFAAFKAVEESIRRPLKYYQNNVNGLVNFLSLLDEFSLKNFIFSSSAVVYGSLAESGQPLQERNCMHRHELSQEPPGAEGLPQAGCMDITNPYGRTKYFAEAILSDLVTSDPSWNIVVLRYFNPIGCDVSGLLGEDPKGVPANLLPVVAQVITGIRKELTVFGGDWNTPDGTAVRDFIHVTDLARGHTAALAACGDGRIKSGYRTYNLGAGTGHSILEVLGAMESALGRQIPWKMVSRRAGDVSSSVAAVERARDELGWVTQKSLEDACRDICNCLKLS